MTLFEKVLMDPRIAALAGNEEVDDLLDKLEEFLEAESELSLVKLRKFSKELYAHNEIREAFTRALDEVKRELEQSGPARTPVEEQASSEPPDTTKDQLFKVKCELLNARGQSGRKSQYLATDFLTSQDIAELELDSSNNPDPIVFKKLVRRSTNRHQSINDSIAEFAEDNGDYGALSQVINLTKYHHVQLFKRNGNDETKPKFILVSRERNKTSDFDLMKIEIEFESEAAARRACNPMYYREFTEGGLLTPLSFYIKDAEALDRFDKIPKDEIGKTPPRLGLVLAFYECQTTLSRSSVRDTNSIVYQLLGNQPLPEPNETRDWVRTQVRAFSRRLRSKNEQRFRSVSDFRRLSKHLASAFRFFYSRLEVKDERFNLSAAISEKYKEIIRNFHTALQELMNAPNEEAEEKIREQRASDLVLANDSNYQTLTIGQLDIILNHAIDYLPAYNFIMLQLLTCLRNTEVERLDSAFLLGKELNYKESVEVRGKKRFLSTKTMHKVPRSKLNNPSTCALTRYILKHEQISSANVQKLFSGQGVTKESIRKELEEAFGGKGGEHQRSLRTAAATWLYRCGEVESRFDGLYLQGVTAKMIADKMAHKDTSMVERIYAQSHPADRTSDKYDKYFTFEKLNCKNETEFPVISPMKLTLDNDKEYLLWSQFNALELMLTKRYVKDMGNVLRRDPQRFLKMKTLLAEEARLDEVKKDEVDIPEAMVHTA